MSIKKPKREVWRQKALISVNFIIVYLVWTEIDEETKLKAIYGNNVDWSLQESFRMKNHF